MTLQENKDFDKTLIAILKRHQVRIYTFEWQELAETYLLVIDFEPTEALKVEVQSLLGPSYPLVVRAFVKPHQLEMKGVASAYHEL